jgi:hypothetical protein
MLDFLKTMPDMTNTPEITMHEKAPKIPMSKRIRNYKAANPDATAKQIAEAVGTTAVYVYQALANPPKKAKPVASATTAAPNTVSIKDYEELKFVMVATARANDDLENEVIELKAIVKYLERRLKFLNDAAYD